LLTIDELRESLAEIEFFRNYLLEENSQKEEKKVSSK